MMEISGVNISHPDKVLFPESGLRKQDLATYFQRIADRMLPFLRNRPLTLRSFPEGIEADGFFNKNAPGHFPDFIHRIPVPARESGRDEIRMSSAGAARDLVYFVGQNAIEFHATLSTEDTLENPDQMIFDFDPSDGDFEKVRKLALAFARMLDDMEVSVFWKTTGSRGLHAHIPLHPTHKFVTVKRWATKLAKRFQETCSDQATLEQRKEKRGNRVFIDTLRNEYGQTVIVPYGIRARPGAPVAVPIRASELNDSSLQPDRVTINNLFRRLAQMHDPWKQFGRSRISDLGKKL